MSSYRSVSDWRMRGFSLRFRLHVTDTDEDLVVWAACRRERLRANASFPLEPCFRTRRRWQRRWYLLHGHDVPWSPVIVGQRFRVAVLNLETLCRRAQSAPILQPAFSRLAMALTEACLMRSALRSVVAVCRPAVPNAARYSPGDMPGANAGWGTSSGSGPSRAARWRRMRLLLLLRMPGSDSGCRSSATQVLGSR